MFKFRKNYGLKKQKQTYHFITEHNLAHYWRRPGLFPRSMGFPIPLIDTAEDYNEGVLNRSPGNLRADSSAIRYRQRNLLAGEMHKVKKTI